VSPLNSLTGGSFRQKLLDSDREKLPVLPSSSNRELRRAAWCRAQIDMALKSRDKILERGRSEAVASARPQCRAPRCHTLRALSRWAGPASIEATVGKSKAGSLSCERSERITAYSRRSPVIAVCAPAPRVSIHKPRPIAKTTTAAADNQTLRAHPTRRHRHRLCRAPDARSADDYTYRDKAGPTQSHPAVIKQRSRGAALTCRRKDATDRSDDELWVFDMHEVADRR
jgi:hypothetical protein